MNSCQLCSKGILESESFMTYKNPKGKIIGYQHFQCLDKRLLVYNLREILFWKEREDRS